VIGELARKTWRGESQSPRSLRQILALLRLLSTALRRSCLGKLPRRCPSYPRSKRPSQFLQYLRTVWESGEAGEQGQLALAEQDVLLTVPASFDEEGTRTDPARLPSKPVMTMSRCSKKPQAAFLRMAGKPGVIPGATASKSATLVLVCDIGGGTTDFSLIMVSEESGELTLKTRRRR